ncbi:MAG TPA: hemolysin family protein [Steroidobacteraceae bacterium]|jgi:putative hemolysin|nr:hemolysin family protein [Steroidobacteraceae bacterium]
MLAYFLVLVALILVNGLFAMAELSLFSSRSTRLKQLAREGRRGARAALRLLEDPTRFLSTVQFYITLIGVLAGVYSGARFAEPLAAWLRGIGTLGPVEPYLDTAAYAIVVVGVTFLSLVVGELVPKRWALTNPEGIAARLAPLMEALYLVSKPFVWVLQGSTELVSRALGLGKTSNRAVSEEEIRSMIAEATHTGIFHVAEHQMIEGVLRLPDRTVRSIMVPRGDVVWLDAADSRETVWNAVRTSGHSRYPVCRGQLDELVGVVMTGGLAQWLGDRQAGELAAHTHAPLIVHESTRILRLLELFRESKMHFAVIVDEHGSIEGVVTPSDILTAIAGELPEAAKEEPAEAIARDDSSWLVDGSMSIDDVERLLGQGNMRSGDDYTTVAGFVLAQLGHLPATGENFRWRGLRFEVVDMDGRRIDKLLIQRLAAG